jgi:glutamyl-tRNA synthetase
MLRFAPSPTGDMHIGNLRVALFNYVISQQRNEELTIRIEDTDVNRNIEGKDIEILQLLQKFGIKYLNVTYQSSNIRFHQQFASQLLQEKKAFNCFCTFEELEKKRKEAKINKIPYRYNGTCLNLTDEEVLNREEKSTIRLVKPQNHVTFSDYIKGNVTFQPNEIDSFIILREDKYPTYNFACAIDDMLSDISLIIRGEDHLSNTPKQIAIQKAIGYNKEIEYGHLPIILNNNGKKMSKRDNASSVKWLLEEGFLPESIINYLFLLGNKTPKEIFTLDEVIQWFDLSKISKSPAKFDLNQLKFINKEHLLKLDINKICEILNYNGQEMLNLVQIYREESHTLKEIKDKIDKIFSKKVFSDNYKEGIEKIKITILNINELPNDFKEFKKIVQKETNLKGKNLFKPLRIFFTGLENGPELGELYPNLKIFIKDLLLWV